MIGLFLVGLFCAVVFVVSAFLDSDSGRLIALAERAPTRNLHEVQQTDGDAWVKVRLEPASNAVILVCAGQKCLWFRTEEYRMVMDDIRHGGKWTKRLLERPLKDEKKSIPFDLVDGEARVTVFDALGVSIWPDLLQERRTAFPADAQIEGGISSPGRRVETFLPSGAEGWVLGKFESGKPKVLETGQFILTSLGPERFGKTIGENASFFTRVRNWSLAGAVLCGVLLFLLIVSAIRLKRR